MTIANITTGPYWDESRGAAGTVLIPLPHPPRVNENVAIGATWVGTTAAATLERSVALVRVDTACYVLVQAATPDVGDIGTMLSENEQLMITLRAGEKIWVKAI